MTVDDIRRAGAMRWLDDGQDEIWTVTDICELFDVTANTVYKMNDHRKIPYHYFCKHVRYFRSDVLNYFMARTPDDPELNTSLSIGELPPIFKRRNGPKQPKPKKVKSEDDGQNSGAAA